MSRDEEKKEEQKEVASIGVSKEMEEVMEEKGVPSDIEKGALVFINGKRIRTEALASLQIQYVAGTLIIDIDYDEEEQKRWKEVPLEKEKEATANAKKVAATPEDKPSANGVSIPKSDGPEVYDLEEKDFLKLCTMSALRTNKTSDKGPASKLKVKASGKHKVEKEELRTEEYNIQEVQSMSSALNDLAVQEQKIQKDPNVVKVREVSKPKIVFKGNLFTLTETFKLYKKEGEDEE